jgi:glycine oxidase
MLADYIIVGQGIAGSVLSHLLMQERKKIVVIDNNPKSSSSKVAAGLYNPVVFKRLSKSWMIDKVLPFADDLYQSMEQDFGEKIHFKKSIAKIFVNEEERQFWLKKAGQTEMRDYLTSQIISLSSKVNNSLGASPVLRSGYLDVNKMLSLISREIREKAEYFEEEFEHSELIVDPKAIKYKDIRAKKIIFCEGHKGALNPHFSWLPFALTKGEMLIVEIKDFEKDYIVNKGVFILGIGNNLYKVGATYEWQDLTETTTKKAREELTGKLEKVINVEYRLVDQVVGIRPTVKDRRPFLGNHPQMKNVFIFNGMGTKAVLLAPYFGAQMVDFMEKGIPLNKECDIKRYYKMHGKQV